MGKLSGKKFAFVLLLVGLIWGFAPSLGMEVCADDHTHEGYTAWNTATGLPDVAGNYYLNTDVTLANTWSVPSGTTNLCLNGKNITMTGSGSVIVINSGRILNLYDCNTTTKQNYSINANNLAELVPSGGTELIGGCITGGKSSNGAAVY